MGGWGPLNVFPVMFVLVRFDPPTCDSLQMTPSSQGWIEYVVRIAENGRQRAKLPCLEALLKFLATLDSIPTPIPPLGHRDSGSTARRLELVV